MKKFALMFGLFFVFNFFVSLGFSETAVDTETIKDELYIMDKDKENIYVNELPLKVNSKTKILDTQANPISLKKLPIPCKAEIEYIIYPNSNKREVISIQIKGQKLGAKKPKSIPKGSVHSGGSKKILKFKNKRR